MSDKEINKLANLNLAAGVLHGSLGIGLSILAGLKFDNSKNSVDTSTYLINPVRYEPQTDPNGDALPDPPNVITQSGEKFQIGVKKIVSSDTSSIIIMVLLFVFLTAFFHFLIYGLRKTLYTDMINNENNKLRWVEYAITSTLMIILISISLGTKDFQTIILTAVSNIAVMMLGQVIEQMISENRKTEAVLTTVIAWLLFAGYWTIISQTFGNVIGGDAEVPAFVWAIYVLLFIFYTGFGFVQLLQLSGVLKSYFKVEISYISLSFVSKFLLALLIFYGCISRQDIN
jgi:hypothetical protein